MRFWIIFLAGLLHAHALLAEDISLPPVVKSVESAVSPEAELVRVEDAAQPKPNRLIDVQDLPPVGLDGQTYSSQEGIDLVDPNDEVAGETFVPITLGNISLHGIQKLTGRSELLTGAAGDTLRFDSLEITLYKCSSVLDQGEKGFAALVEVREALETASDGVLFRGWLFSTSPSLSGIRHPQYDLLLKECGVKNVQDDTAPAANDQDPA